MDVDAFLADLASSAPVPGGGSVAALQVAMGAALVEMVCNLTIGRKKYQSAEAEATQIRDRAIALRSRARALVDEDAAAYAAVALAVTRPRATAEESEARTAAVQSALKGAAQPPLETMRCAFEVLDLARTLVPIGNPAAVSDVATAAASAFAGFEAARLNVEINMAAVRDEAWREQTRNQLSRFDDPGIYMSYALAGAESVIRDRA
jgi:formiminotetrahydrofolate cyclodeaminase